MNAKSVIPFVAAALFSLSAHAYDCSGGEDGGMDATGNQCNEAAAAVVESSGTAAASSHLPQTGTSAPPVISKQAPARPVAARRHLLHAQIKHS